MSEVLHSAGEPGVGRCSDTTTGQPRSAPSSAVGDDDRGELLAQRVLLEAEPLAHQLEAVLAAACRMAGGTRAENERASWLHTVALELAQRLAAVVGGAPAPAGAEPGRGAGGQS